MKKEFAMSLIEGIIGPVVNLIDKVIPDPKARDAAKPELIKLQGRQEMDIPRTQLSGILAEAQSAAHGPAVRDQASSMSSTQCCCGRSRWG